jgi:hypothetical protein
MPTGTPIQHSIIPGPMFPYSIVPPGRFKSLVIQMLRKCHVSVTQVWEKPDGTRVPCRSGTFAN